MKKLQFKSSFSREILTREQLKTIMGGDLASGSGSESNGSCAGFLDACYGRINCCNNLVCNSTWHKCYMS